MENFKNKKIRLYFKGFTLIELLVAVAIIGVISSIGFRTFNSAQTKGRDAQRKADLNNIKIALEAYHADNGQYPPSGQSEASHNSSAGANWIPGLSPDYMKDLPKDPKQAQIPVFLALKTFLSNFW